MESNDKRARWRASFSCPCRRWSCVILDAQGSVLWLLREFGRNSKLQYLTTLPLVCSFGKNTVSIPSPTLIEYGFEHSVFSNIRGSSSTTMSWKEISPGRFERPLDSVEIFFKTIADAGTPLKREHWAITVCVQFRLDPCAGNAETALRQAWKTIRYDHPQIAAFAQGNNIIYEVPDALTFNSWQRETFLIAPETTAEDLIASARPSTLPTMHFLPKTSEVVIQSSHWRIDGIGALILLNNFFKALAKPRHIQFGSEGKNLSPSLTEAAGLATDPSKEQDLTATRLLMEYAGNMPSIGLPTESSNKIPGATHRSELKLSIATTDALLRACKAHDTTVTTAFHAALIVAMQQMASNQPLARNYTSWRTFNFRPYLPSASSKSMAHPMAVHICGLPITFEPSTFSDNVSHLGPLYQELSSPSRNTKLRSILVPYNRKITAMISQPAPADMPEPTEPQLQSMGVVETYLKQNYEGVVEITDFWLAVEMLTKNLALHVWTWQEQLTLSISYNERSYKEGFVQEFLRSLRGVLLRELCVSSA